MVHMGHMCNFVPAVTSEHAVIEGRQCPVNNEPWLVVLGPPHWPICLTAFEPFVIQGHVVALLPVTLHGQQQGTQEPNRVRTVVLRKLPG
jgi:hypothetical protein